MKRFVRLINFNFYFLLFVHSDYSLLCVPGTVGLYLCFIANSKKSKRFPEIKHDLR